MLWRFFWSPLWVYFFQSAVHHPDAVTAKAPLPSRAFVLEFLSQVLLVCHFPYSFFFKFVSLKNGLIFAPCFYLHDLIQLDFGSFCLPLCFLTSVTQLSLLSSPSFPFLAGTLLSLEIPFLVFVSPVRLGIIPKMSPPLCLGLEVPTLSFVCFVFSFFSAKIF